jgi:predicted nucleic acid-binding protein
LQSGGVSIDPLLELFERGLVRIDFSISSYQPDVWESLRKYADQPMSLADACLVRMAELNDNCQVFTTDRDFLIYRRKGRSVIPLIAPFT